MFDDPVFNDHDKASQSGDRISRAYAVRRYVIYRLEPIDELSNGVQLLDWKY